MTATTTELIPDNFSELSEDEKRDILITVSGYLHNAAGEKFISILKRLDEIETRLNMLERRPGRTIQ